MAEEQDNQTVKNWLDYLARLNDRHERQGQTSGVNSWVLLSIIAGLLYKGVPALPALLANNDALRASGIVFALELNCFALVSTLHSTFIQYLNRDQFPTPRTLTSRVVREG